MKSTLVLVVVISAQVVYGGILDQLNFTLAANIGQCASLKGVNPDQILALSTLQSPVDTPVQCFLACIAKLTGMMNADNTFDKTAVVNTMRPLVAILSFGKSVDSTQVTNTIVNTCTALPTTADKCLAAKNAFDCFVDTARKNGL